MSDDAPLLLFRRSFGSLRPDSDITEEWLSRVPNGDVIAIPKPKRKRNQAMHRLYWALVAMVAKNLPGERKIDPEEVHAAIKIRCGIYTEVRTKGGVVQVPGSISFSRMDGDAFEKFFAQVCDLIAREFLPGVTSAALREEVETMVGIRRAA